MVKTVTYMGESSAQSLRPSSRAVLVSIADPGHVPPCSNEQGWMIYYRDYFIDAEFDHSIIKMFVMRLNKTSGGITCLKTHISFELYRKVNSKNRTG